MLSESCQESCGRGGRDFLFSRRPPPPRPAPPGSTGGAGSGRWVGRRVTRDRGSSMVAAEVLPQRLKAGPLRPTQGMAEPGHVRPALLEAGQPGVLSPQPGQLCPRYWLGWLCPERKTLPRETRGSQTCEVSMVRSPSSPVGAPSEADTCYEGSWPA